MDITSLLQEAPSRDRTRRKQQPWEDNPVDSKALTTRVEDQLPSMSVLSASVAGDYNPPGPSANNTGHQQPSRSFQVIPDYPLPPSNNSSQSQPQQQPPSSYSYYQKHPEREKERAGLPLNPPPDYVDVDTPEGTIRMKKQDYLNPSRLGARPISSSQAIHSPGLQQIPLSDPNLANITLNRAPSARNGQEEITAQAIVVDRPLPPPPRTPSPMLDAVHLGLYIYPSLPFPIRPSAIPYNRRTTFTVLVPSSLLPHHHNARTTTAGIYADSRARRLWGGVPHMDQRRIYTDDSDVVFAALHSEVIPDDPALFSSGKDLKLTLRLYPAPESGHFTGGTGAAGLTSASWGNAHEGCAYTIQEATWVAPSTSRTYTRQTRKARMAEYAQRRATIMTSPSSSLLLSPSPSPEVLKSSDPGKSLPRKPEMHPIEENMTTLSVVGGWRAAVGFKYDPMTLYLMLFALTSSSSSLHAPKRRKLEPPRPSREIILANSKQESDRVILAPKPPPPQNEPGSAMEVDDAKPTESNLADGFMRYDLYREARNPPTISSEESVQANESLKSKGVRFTTEVVNKDDARDPDKTSWTRTLLHADLGPQDILCIPDCVMVGEDKYAVDTWHWKSEPEDGKKSAGKVSQAARSKKRGLRKRKMKARKAKGDGLATVAVTLEKDEPSKDEVMDASARVERTASIPAVVEVPSTTQPDILGGDTSEPFLLKVAQPSTSAPATVKEDREEGELSDETPAVA